MKVAVCSDVHLEFGKLELANDEGAEVLILSGDIMVAEDLHDHAPQTSPQQTYPGRRQLAAQSYRDFLATCSANFPHVVYVAGNHEFYHGKWYGALDYLREECAKFPNVHFMENNSMKIGDFTFIGCTLWTDLNKGDPMTHRVLVNEMNDYRQIKNDRDGHRRIRPSDTAERHLRSKEYIQTLTDNATAGEKFIVVGHHAPSKASTHPRYVDDYHINGAYSSDLSEFILDRPQIKLWTHGHTHEPFDYMIGSTRIVCNPRGYIGYESRADEFKLQYLEV